MANCNDYISADDLKTGKQAILHIEHVAKSRDANGNHALDITDTIRGESVTNKTLDGLENLYTTAISQVGYITLKSFQLGAPLPNNELTLPNQVLQDETDGEYYRWDGNFPKLVPSGSTPASTGGIGIGKWLSVGDATLRGLLTGPAGDGLNNLYGGTGWTGSDAAGDNIYNNDTITYKNATRQRFSIPETPIPDPIIWLEKISSATRDDGIKRWDQGVIYNSLRKVSGSAYTCTTTSVAKHEGGNGHSIGHHMRGESRNPQAESWGGWSYGAVLGDAVQDGATSTIAHEFNLNNRGPDKGWMENAVQGSVRGLVCVTQDKSNPVTQMITIGRGSEAPNGYIWTGMLFRGNSISTPTEELTEVGNGEYIRLEGSLSSKAANGIRFRTNYFRSGISFSEAGFSNNCAILMGDNQRITVGTGPANTTYLSFNRTENWANFANLRIRLNGNQVISERRTGWGSPTGAVSRAAFNSGTITHEQLAQVVAALIQDLHASTGHGLIG